MSGTSTPGPAPDALELAALLCSRVCHDLISPVGAIVNGLEVLDDNPKPEDRDFALDLIRKSARTASARLQFCRLAFGAAGSSGAQIDLGDAQTMAKGHIEDGKITLEFAECIGAWDGAPACPVNDVHARNVTPEKADQIIAELKVR